jgi:predicted permease
MLNTMNIVLTIFAMIAFGFYLTKTKLIDEKIAKFIATLVVTYVVPATLINNMMGYFTLEGLQTAGPALLAPFLSISATFAISFPIAILLKIPKGQRGVFSALFGFSNTIFVGLPVCIALFGNEAAPYALLTFAANSILFWGIAAPYIRRDANPGENVHWKETVKKILSPALITLVSCFILILFRVQMPKVIMDTTRYIGSMSTPLALIYIGHILAGLGIKNLKVSRNLVIVCIGRFIISPLITVALMKLFHIEGIIARVTIIQSAMPAMAQAPIVAAMYGSDTEFAATAVSLSTLIGLMFLPVYMFLFTAFGI